MKILYFARISEELGKNQELLLIKGKLNYFILVAAVIQNCTEGIKNKNSVLVVVV